jgi:hypothetical protein
VLSDYTDDQLDLVAKFLERSAAATRAARASIGK